MNRTPGLIAVLAMSIFAVSCGSSPGINNPPIQVGSPSYVYVSTASGTVSGFMISGNTLTPVPGSPFINAGTDSIGMATAGNYLYVANHGTYDISGYSFNSKSGTLAPVSGSPFKPFTLDEPLGPVGLAPCPQGKLFSLSDGIFVNRFTISPTGELTSASATGIHMPGSVLSMAIDPQCKKLYFANSDSDFISLFTISENFPFSSTLNGGALAGTKPVSVALDLAGKFLFVANSGSDNVSVFAVDAASGALTEVSGSPFAAGSQPSAVMQADSYVFVTNAGSNDISVYTFNSTTGALSPVMGSPFPTGAHPAAIAFAYTNLNVSPGGMLVFTANQDSRNVSVFVVGSGGSLHAVLGSPFSINGTPQGITVVTGPQ